MAKRNPLVCPFCGHTITSEDQRFCDWCGEKIEKEEVPEGRSGSCLGSLLTGIILLLLLIGLMMKK